MCAPYKLFTTIFDEFREMFKGRFNLSSLNDYKEVYLINGREYDTSFLSAEEEEELMKLSVIEKKNLLLEKCKNHEIIRTEEMKKNEKFKY